MEPQAHYYENYFKNMVGVTHPNNAEVVNVHILAHNHYMFMPVSYTHLYLDIIDERKGLILFGSVEE